MAKTVWGENKQPKEAYPKKTSIGHGRRKRGSFAWRGKKKYSGQGK